MNVHQYQLIEPVVATAGGELHIARRVHDGTTVLLKLLDRNNASATDEARFRHEYALLQLLHAPEIIRPLALHDEGGRLALVLEHFTGESLEIVLAREQWNSLAKGYQSRAVLRLVEEHRQRSLASNASQ